MKISDFGLARNTREKNYYRKTSSVSCFYFHRAITGVYNCLWNPLDFVNNGAAHVCEKIFLVFNMKFSI